MYDRFAITRTRSAIIGILLWLAAHCDGLQYQPLEVYANGDECALILDARGRTSLYDYTYNLLRGSFPTIGGTQTCITYEAVNHAYVEARKRINVARPKLEVWRPEDLATVGELLLDITTNLAQTYGLTYEEIEKSLPLIDTSKTFIREVCPAFLSNVECRPGKYRRYDGLCTNLQNPTWGATLSPFTRLMSPRFADSLSAPRISVTGRDLPLSRVVSRTMHPDEGYHDHAGTVMVIAWGQFMDHDYTLTATPLDPLNRNDPEECCSRPPHLKNPYCNEIHIPEDDYFYRLFNVRCMDFVRAFPAVRPGCRLGSRVPFNLLTGVLDGNTVYGITEAFARKLRTGYGGLLRMNPVFSEYGLKDLLPLKLDIPDEGCTRPNRSMYCFEAGEIRVNEQLVLTCMHTLLAREHNRLAKELAQVNPHWDDETLFQEARRIVIAEIQHITYNEFLPILLGKDVMGKFGLLLEKEKYWDGYDPSINPGVIDAFAAAAFRFGHSLLPTAVERWSKAHKFIASKRLSDLIRRPYDLYRAGVFDEYFMGLMNQVAQAMDDSITQEVTNHLFKKVGAKFGMDLVSFNMQRGREFGIPSYMEFRKYCGLSGAETFEELFGSMPNETISRYHSIFEHPSDIDLWSGGVSERPLPGSMLGPTFACVIATQFSHSRRGDRFWYELPNQPSSFTLEQLNEIRKSKLARLICDNTDLIDTVQIYPMVLPDHEINPRVPCRSGILPGIDLSKWAEFPTTSHAAQYHTTPKKPAQAASTIKIVLERAHISPFNRKQKVLSLKGNTANSLKNKSSEYPHQIFQLKKFTRRPRLIRKMLERLNKQMTLPNFSLKSHQYENINLKPVIKTTTNIKAFQRKKKADAQILEDTKNIQKIIAKKRLKRSYQESEDNLMTTKSLWDIASKAPALNNPRLKRYDQQTQTFLTRKNVTDHDLKVAKSTAIPNIPFYKRIWEYINGTRSHFNIINDEDYSSLNNPEKNNSTCTDKDQITTSLSRKVESQVANPDIKPEREFYKRIWDIINVTQSTYDNVKARSKRNSSIPENSVSSSKQLCMQAREADYNKDGQLQTTSEKAIQSTRERTYSSERSDPDHSISGFRSIVNKTQQLPKTLPADTVILNNNSILSPRVNITSASEVAELNTLSDKFQSNANYSSADDSTGYLDETHNDKPPEITEPGPPYSFRRENSTILSSLLTKHVIDDIPRGRNQTRYAKHHLEDNPIYDPMKIPYVEVPDYADQREYSLEKDNKSSIATKYKEYDDSDCVDLEEHNADISSKTASVEVATKLLQNIQDGNGEHESILNAKVSDRNGTESKDSIEHEDKYDARDTKSYNNTRNYTNDDIYDSVESALSKEQENFTDFVPIRFDINEYKKPFNLHDFITNSSVFKGIRTSSNGENAKYEEDPNNGFKEYRTYSTYPEGQQSSYLTKNQESHDDYGSVIGDQDGAEPNTHIYSNENTKNRKINSDYYYDDKNYFKHLFKEDSDKESSDVIDTEDEFLSRYFPEDVLHHLRENLTNEEAKKRQESRNKESLPKTLSDILNKEDRFSGLTQDLDKMIEGNETAPIRYKNFWSLEYKSPRKENKAKQMTEV